MFSGAKANVAEHFGKPHFEFIRHDITQPLFVEVDEIYHLACPASPVFYQENPIKTIKTCVIGTMNMLGLARRVGARMLITSTSEVYGDPKVHPQTEDYWGHVNPIGIRSCYDEGKRIAETLMFEYHRHNKVDIAVARIFNTYGPRMLENDGRVVSNFIVQALRGKKKKQNKTKQKKKGERKKNTHASLQKANNTQQKREKAKERREKRIHTHLQKSRHTTQKHKSTTHNKQTNKTNNAIL